MSALKVEILRVDKVSPHPDPETTALDLAEVKGWQVVVRKGSVTPGGRCVYFPLDSLLPVELSDAIGVTKYLSKGRVRAAKLRGTPSYGLLWPLEPAGKAYPELCSMKDGDDVAELLGVTKWEPPLEFSDADTEVPHPAFLSYTEIENLRNYPDVLKEGEEVVITEKVHGCNARWAMIDGEFMAGSHNRRLKYREDNRHWYTFSDEMKKLLERYSSEGPVILYGEIYGDGIQDLKYGQTRGRIEARVFDMSINGRYLDYDHFQDRVLRYNIMTMPILYRGPWSMDVLEKFRDSDSQLGGADCMMEGVVIRLEKERQDPFVGRVILKYVWDRYLTRKGGTEKK